MRYVGGKGRIAKQIASKIRTLTEASVIYEPFMGGAGVTGELSGVFDKVIASDSHEDIALMWQAVVDGWVPPTEISEDDYRLLKTAPASALRGFVGAGCSFGGRWFEGYARGGVDSSGRPRNHQAESSRSVMRSALKFNSKVSVEHRDYRETPLVPGTAIYCDPPYFDSRKRFYREGFDSEAFWDWAKGASQIADVFVSEYRAPSEWRSVWSAQKRQSVSRPDQGRESRTEHLFVWSSDVPQ